MTKDLRKQLLEIIEEFENDIELVNNIRSPLEDSIEPNFSNFIKWIKYGKKL